MADVGDSIRTRLEEIELELTTATQEHGRLGELMKNLRQEKRELARVIRQLDGSRSDGPAVTDEQILEAVRAVGGDGVPGMRVAQDLDVTLRNVARKLRKLVDDGHLTGDPSSGYTLVTKES